MKFSDSGLPQNDLVEKAFDYSFSNVMEEKDESVKDVHRQLDKILSSNMTKLDQMKSKISADEYNARKDHLEKYVNTHRKNAVKEVTEALTQVFSTTCIAPAQELINNTTLPSPDLLASCLLLKSVQTPMDYMDLKKAFGNPVAQTVAEAIQLMAYPGKRPVTFRNVSNDAKLCYAGHVMASMVEISDALKKAASEKRVLQLQSGQEKEMFSDLQHLWNLDEKLNQRFVEVLNRLMVAAHIPSEVRIDASGKPEMVKREDKPKDPKPPGPKPPGPNGGGSIGDQVF